MIQVLSKITALAIGLACLLTGCKVAQPKTVTQFSTVDALLSGVYDGKMSCGKLLKYGNTGIGTFEKLDGEMVMSEGVIYQVKGDGTVRVAPSTLLTPFATVSQFKASQTFAIHTSVTLSQLEDEIEKRCSDMNGLYTIRAKGTFTRMKTRSVHPQEKPYPALVDAAKDQVVFSKTDVSGKIVGFRCPAYMKGINVPGYHLHFISDDLKFGGHILDIRVTDLEVEISDCNRLVLLLPEKDEMFSQADLKKDRTAELNVVEKGR